MCFPTPHYHWFYILLSPFLHFQCSLILHLFLYYLFYLRVECQDFCYCFAHLILVLTFFSYFFVQSTYLCLNRSESWQHLYVVVKERNQWIFRISSETGKHFTSVFYFTFLLSLTSYLCHLDVISWTAISSRPKFQVVIKCNKADS